MIGLIRVRRIAAAMLVWMLASCASPPQPARDAFGEIRSVLAAQEAAWNKGDIDGFMAHYWQDEDLAFASGGTVTRGWAPTLARYKARYDTPGKMGVLSFKILEIEPIAGAKPEAAIVLGEWRLKREKDAPGGLFTLLMRRIDGRWVVVRDHTSSEK